jgi:hypothetical protein
MKRSTVLKLLAFVGMIVAPVAQAQVINFHDSSQGTIPGYNQLYFGQGAYSDPGNNVWNGFSAGTYAGGGPGSTLFYGNSNRYPASGGNPGNPYATYGANGHSSTSGTVLFGTGGTIDGSGSPTSVPAGNATSRGLLSPITLSANFLVDNGATPGATLGTPSWLLTSAAVSSSTATFTFHNVPVGSYLLYCYGSNYDNDRGTLFAVSSGLAHNGINATLNQANGTHPGQSFIEGVNYAYFQGVTPDVSGNITVNASGNPLDGVGNPNLPGEADVNGFQLVTVAIPEPSTMAILGLGLAGLFAVRRRR